MKGVEGDGREAGHSVKRLYVILSRGEVHRNTNGQGMGKDTGKGDKWSHRYQCGNLLPIGVQWLSHQPILWEGAEKEEKRTQGEGQEWKKAQAKHPTTPHVLWMWTLRETCSPRE